MDNRPSDNPMQTIAPALPAEQTNAPANAGDAAATRITGVEYPEIDRMRAVQHESQAIGGFITWLSEQGMVICAESRPLSLRMPYMPIDTGIERLLARYFEIDLDLVENEKRSILASLRDASPTGRGNK